MKRWLWLIGLMAAAVAPSAAQFELLAVDASGVRTAPPTYDLGSIYAGETASAKFRLRNVTSTKATAATIAIGGTGFALTTPALPAQVDPQAWADFTVAFHTSDLGGYSAVLRAENVTIVLTATVQPGLTYLVENAPLGSVIDFGSVVRGATARRRFTILNQTPLLLTIPAISVSAGDFAVAGPSPAGTVLRPLESAAFAVDFAPSAAGARSATLTAGARSYALKGAGADPPLPKPTLSLDLARPGSAQAGALVITFDAPSAAAGTGTAALDFRGPPDPAIAFAAGGRTTSFPVAVGDTRVVLPFQTGSTAGTLAFTVQVGANSSQITAEIAAAPPAITAVQGLRSAGTIEVRVTGYDNTRSVSQLSFTFYDGSGRVMAPGGIGIDAGGDFARYFGGSGLGGVFLMRAVFPVTGDTGQVTSFEVTLTGAAGAVTSGRTGIE